MQIIPTCGINNNNIRLRNKRSETREGDPKEMQQRKLVFDTHRESCDEGQKMEGGNWCKLKANESNKFLIYTKRKAATGFLF